jgi:putative tryptophan/tyrosine transport system substrate-binding protein
MKRRHFIKLVGGAAASWPLAAFAQDARKPPLIGYLSGAPLAATTSAGMFRQGLQDLGYTEGRDFQITYRSSDGYQDRLPALAEELVRLNPDVIVAAGLDAVVAVRNVTQTIPVVSATLADAVHLGLIANEARPTGNVTGIEPYVAGLPAKQMEFAREIMPGTTKIGLLTNLSDPKAPPQAQELLAAGRGLEVEVTSSDADRPEKIEGALQMLASRPVDIVIVLQTSMLLGNSRQIAALALAKRLPTFYGYRAHVTAGGLASYGVDLEWCWRRSASFVDKILHGARPGDLPVEFPTKMLLAVNLKTAKALGLTVPSSLLVRADEVIE